jgi:hypothetical protein
MKKKAVSYQKYGRKTYSLSHLCAYKIIMVTRSRSCPKIFIQDYLYTQNCFPSRKAPIQTLFIDGTPSLTPYHSLHTLLIPTTVAITVTDPCEGIEDPIGFTWVNMDTILCVYTQTTQHL